MSKSINLTCKLFYSDYKMPDKMLYIQKIMDSCNTQEQLDSTLKWGKNVLWNFQHVIDNAADGRLSVQLKIINRIQNLENELVKYYKNLSKNLPLKNVKDKSRME